MDLEIELCLFSTFDDTKLNYFRVTEVINQREHLFVRFTQIPTQFQL